MSLINYDENNSKQFYKWITWFKVLVSYLNDVSWWGVTEGHLLEWFQRPSHPDEIFPPNLWYMLIVLLGAHKMRSSSSRRPWKIFSHWLMINISNLLRYRPYLAESKWFLLAKMAFLVILCTYHFLLFSASRRHIHDGCTLLNRNIHIHMCIVQTFGPLSSVVISTNTLFGMIYVVHINQHD